MYQFSGEFGTSESCRWMICMYNVRWLQKKSRDYLGSCSNGREAIVCFQPLFIPISIHHQGSLLFISPPTTHSISHLLTTPFSIHPFLPPPHSPLNPSAHFIHPPTHPSTMKPPFHPSIYLSHMPNSHSPPTTSLPTTHIFLTHLSIHSLTIHPWTHPVHHPMSSIYPFIHSTCASIY